MQGVDWKAIKPWSHLSAVEYALWFFADQLRLPLLETSLTYLTRVGKASSLQKDRDTKRTPAGVAGGRLVISCKSCSASSSVGLQREYIEKIYRGTFEIFIPAYFRVEYISYSAALQASKSEKQPNIHKSFQASNIRSPTPSTLTHLRPAMPIRAQ